MNRQTLTDSRYHTIGDIDTASDGKQTVWGAHDHVVGYDDPRTSITRDAQYHTVGHGNLLASLIASHQWRAR